MTAYYKPEEERPFAYVEGREARFTVDLWGEHPLDNDDTCWDGQSFETYSEALSVFHTDPPDTSIKWVILQGPDGSGIWEERRNPNFHPSDPDDWRREQAMQTGMAFGCEGWNDYYGY